MIDLVLDESRPDALERLYLLLGFGVDEANSGLGRALDLRGEIGDRQAALLVGAHLAAALEDDWIDHDQGLFRRFVLRRVHDDEPPRDTDLRRGKADA